MAKASFFSRLCINSLWCVDGASVLNLMDLQGKDPDVDQVPRAL
jgi:hypothetical protein